MKRWTEVIDKWEFASLLCAEDYAFWSNDTTGLHLLLNMNDVFVPAADAEEITEDELNEIWLAWINAADKGAALVEWVRAKREKQG